MAFTPTISGNTTTTPSSIDYKAYTSITYSLIHTYLECILQVRSPTRNFRVLGAVPFKRSSAKYVQTFIFFPPLRYHVCHLRQITLPQNTQTDSRRNYKVAVGQSPRSTVANSKHTIHKRRSLWWVEPPLIPFSPSLASPRYHSPVLSRRHSDGNGGI